MIVQCLSWPSDETSPRLTPDEVEKLFDTLTQLSRLGVLNGKFKHSCVPLYWVRTGREN